MVFQSSFHLHISDILCDMQVKGDYDCEEEKKGGGQGMRRRSNGTKFCVKMP